MALKTSSWQTALTVLITFSPGLIMHRWKPAFAKRVSRIASEARILLLTVAYVPVLVKMGPD